MKHISDSGETVICMSCSAPNSRSEAFCRECGAQILITSALDPMQAIKAEGELLHKALEGKPRLIAVVGTWILFLPVLAASIWGAINLTLNTRGTTGFFFFWVLVGLSFICFVALYRVTRNYLINRGKK